MVLRATVVTELSGPLAEYGRAGAAALDIWTEYHRRRFGTEVALRAIDTHPEPAVAAQMAERERPDLLFGPYGSSPTAAVAKATSRLIWNHGGARAPQAGNLIPVLAPASSYFTGAIEVVLQADHDVRSLSLLYGDTGFGRAVGKGAEQHATLRGLRVFPTAPEASPANTEMLLVVGGFAEERDAAQRLLPGSWRAAGFVGAGVEEVLRPLGTLREGLLGPAQWLPQPGTAPDPDEGLSDAEFLSAYRNRMGGDPPYPAAQAFAAGVIAGWCAHDAGSSDDAALLNAAQALDCTTLFGRFRLDPTTGAQVGHQVLTVQWQDGHRRVVWPSERARESLRYPLS